MLAGNTRTPAPALALTLAAALAAGLPARSAPADGSFMDRLIREMVDPEDLAKITKTTAYGLAGSANPDGRGPNFDNYLSKDAAGLAVLADLKGPGCVRRMFFSGAVRTPAGQDKKNRSVFKDFLGKDRPLKFYFDGESAPRITTTVQNLMNDIVAGQEYDIWQSPWNPRSKVNDYPTQPLAGVAGSGYFCYLPIPYAKSLKITLDAAELRGFSYQIGYHTYQTPPEGFKSYDKAGLTEALKNSDLLARVNDPEVTLVNGFRLRRAVIEDQELAPGAAVEKVIAGPGIIREVEIKWTRSDTSRVRGLVLRCWWDEEKLPSIEVPVDDFFGFDHGDKARVELYVLDRADGNAGNRCGRIWLPMPFARQARIVLTNENSPADGPLPVGMKVQYKPLGSERWGRWDEAFGHLHARWARTPKGAGAAGHTVLKVASPGRLIGCMLMVNKPTSGRDYLEVPERLVIDGVGFGGTTMENFFNGFNGYMRRFNAAYHGVPIQRKGNVTQFRFFIPDSIPFARSFELAFGPADEDVTSVAFWYQNEPHEAFPPLQELAERSRFYRRFRIPGVIEAEEMKTSAMSKPQYHRLRAMSMEDEDGDWSNETQMLFQGQWFTMELPVAEAGTCEVFVYMTKGEGYDKNTFELDGKPCTVKDAAGKTSAIFDPTTAQDFAPSGPLSLGVHELTKGVHLLKFTNVTERRDNRGQRADGRIGFDCVRLVPAGKK